MEEPSGRNRLDEAASPYLRQHADNPVHWQPWDGAALEAAERRDVPVFLSVGYAACHWCHVMAEESFEDTTVAAVLNERYVPVKVDREERPDVDRIYQTICQLVTHSGGWPLSVWLTPDGRPFYVGTYFPPEPSHGRPAFVELLEGLAEAWETDRDEVENRADQWMAAIRDEVETVEAPDAGGGSPADRLGRAADAAVRSADPDNGGFGTQGPKFPQPGRIHLLLRAFDRTGIERYRDVALDALGAMVTGGLFDHVGGGFHRYTVDPGWTVPHFEKMLYDNAEIPRALLAGYQVGGDERLAEAAERTFAFAERELGHPDGAFFSSLDAQSERDGERVEGAFYVWTPAALEAAIDDPTDAALFAARYGVSPGGNFEGSTVLGIDDGIDDLAAAHGLEPAEVEARLETARSAALEARERRGRPPRDEKVLAGWNGLMVSALAEAGIVLDAAFCEPAARALDFVRENLWDGERLARRAMGGEVGVDAYLEDYAFVARGALDLHAATGGHEPLGFAIDLAGAIEAEFWEPDEGALYFTPASGERLAARPQELTDQSTPSSAGVSIDVMAELDGFVDHGRFGELARTALGTYRGRIDAGPLEHAALALAADRVENGSLELTVVAGELPTSWRRAIGGTYLPARTLTVRPPDLGGWLEALDLEAAPPIWADRGSDGDRPTVYACRDFACSPPLTDIEEALAWFGGPGTESTAAGR